MVTHLQYDLAIPTPVTKQVYLLTPMDRATLVNAKWTVSHCPPSLITTQPSKAQLIINMTHIAINSLVLQMSR